MQLTTETVTVPPSIGFTLSQSTGTPENEFVEYKIIRRNGAVVGFEPPKISVAMTKAFLAVNGGTGAASARVREQVARLTEAVVQALKRRHPGFNESFYGFRSFSKLLEEAEARKMLALEHDEKSGGVIIRSHSSDA